MQPALERVSEKGRKFSFERDPGMKKVKGEERKTESERERERGRLKIKSVGPPGGVERERAAFTAAMRRLQRRMQLT